MKIRPESFLRNGILLGSASSITMALAVTVSKIILLEIPALHFTALWGIIGGSLAVGLIYLSGRSGAMGAVRSRAKLLLGLSLVSAVAQLCHFLAIELTNPAVIVFIGRLDLIIASLLGVLVFKERPKRLEIIGAAVAILGVFIMAYIGEGMPLLALVFGLLSASGAAVALFLGKVAVNNIDPLLLTAVTRFGAGMILLSFSAFSTQVRMPHLSTLWLVVLAAALGPFLSFVLLYKALAVTELFRVAILRSITPFAVIFFSFLILDAVPSINEILGGILATTGVTIVAYGDHSLSTQPG